MSSRQSRPALRDDAERNALVEEHRGLCVFAVRHFYRQHPGSRRYYSWDDACQDAARGLMRAAELWRPELAAFSTYAMGWMHSYLQRGLLRDGNLIRRPGWCADDESLPRSFLAGGLDGWDPSEHREDDPAKLAARNEIVALVRRALAKIDPRRAYVLLERAAGKDLAAIGRDLGLSRERVRQLAEQGNILLRKWLRKENLHRCTI